VSKGYSWKQTNTKVAWDKIIWARSVCPRHSLIAWIFIQNRLPTKMRLHKFALQPDSQCVLCKSAVEDSSHLFYECNYAPSIWKDLRLWWNFPAVDPAAHLITCLPRSKDSRIKRRIIAAIFAIAIYNIWRVQNQALFKK